MTVLLLLVAGAFFALLLIVNNLLRAVQRREKISFLETLLAFLALILPLLALVRNHAAEQPFARVNTLTIGAALVIIVASVVTLLIERRQPTRRLNQMRGILGMGVGLLLIAATFFVPVASSLVTVPPLAAGTEAAANDEDSDNNVVNVVNTGAMNTQNQARSTPTNTPNIVMLQLSATPTRMPSVTPTPTNTPFVIASATPGATVDTADAEAATEAIQPSSCSAIVRMNLNLRSGPGSDNELLLTIPFNTALALGRQHEDSNWWQVNYGGKTGWVNGEYLAFNGGCANPVVTTVPPTLTPAPACVDCDSGQETNRINPGAAEAAIYCLASGIKIVDLDIRGASTDSFIVPYAAITAVGTPAENTLIREYRGFRLYRLATGEWQVNAPPNWSGTGEYVFTWEGCDR